MAEIRDLQTTRIPAATADERVTSFLKSVYGWMFVGLLVTAGVAVFIASQEQLVRAIVTTRFLFLALVIGQLGLVYWISARVATLRPSTAATLFIVYAATNGITFSVILLAFTGASIASAFLTTAGMFGALALYGTLTKRSLVGLGQFAFMGLIGIVIASLVGLLLAKRHAAIPDLRVRCHRLHGLDCVRRAEAQGDGARGRGPANGLVRDQRRALAVPRFRESVPDDPAALRRPSLSLRARPERIDRDGQRPSEMQLGLDFRDERRADRRVRGARRVNVVPEHETREARRAAC